MGRAERLYRVEFDTQRDRRYINWEFFVNAHNLNEAKDMAIDAWYSSTNPKYTNRGKDYPHMFHLEAKRVTGKIDKNTEKFYQVSNRYASWG